MWTETTRAKYERAGLRYASDLTAGEWGVIGPLLPSRLRLIGSKKRCRGYFLDAGGGGSRNRDFPIKCLAEKELSGISHL